MAEAAGASTGRSTMRRLRVVELALVVIIVAVAAAGYQYLRGSVPQRDGVVRLPGLVAPVEVGWDEYAIPRVRAASLEDAVFAQGYLHGRDRLWQMDMVRRAVSGRLAEVLGEEGLDADRFMRRLGLRDAAAASLDVLDEPELRVLEAYTRGVNQAIAGRGALPPEFLALRYRPEPWQPVHSLAVAKMMAYTLALYGESVGVANAVRRVGPERARHLYPDYPDWGEITLPAGPAAPEPPALISAIMDGFSIAAASNAWVVSGALTRSGRPILANDPHLQLQAPSLWYLIGLRAPDGQDRELDVVGASIAGAPLVILGHNRAIAWGMTNAQVDDIDIFIELVDPDDPGRYLVPGGSEPFEVAVETIRVRGRDEPVTLQVRRTRHGPVLPPAGPGAPPDTVLSLAWTAHRPSTVVRGILRLNLARDWDEFLAAAAAIDEPHQNLVYADTAGRIGYVMTGTVPIRGDRRPAPIAPRPGWTGDWDWTGTLPFDEHPRALDPGSGIIVTANNRQTAEPVSDLIGRSFMLPFRAERITEELRDRRDLTAADMHRLQLDLVDLYARRYVDRAIEAAEALGDEGAGAVTLLRAWDHRAGPHSRAATLFYVWNENLRRAAARDLYRGEPGYFTGRATAAVLEARALGWSDRPEARYRAIAEAAMRDAIAFAEDVAWQDANHLVHGHLLGDVRILDRVLGLQVGPAPHYGAPNTVNVAHWAFRTPAGAPPFTTRSGPSLRHVADMGNLDGAGGFVTGTGQAGVPFDRHYRDQTGLWRRGGLIPLPLDHDAVERRTVGRLRLEPDV